MAIGQGTAENPVTKGTVGASIDMPAEGLESMFPCSRVEEVFQFFGPAIADRVQQLQNVGGGAVQDLLKRALREHFDASSKAVTAGMLSSLDGAAPNMSRWKRRPSSAK